METVKDRVSSRQSPGRGWLRLVRWRVPLGRAGRCLALATVLLCGWASVLQAGVPARAAGRDGWGGGCAKYIVYDKPVKTGSTAITQSLKRGLRARGEAWATCTADGCLRLAEEICAGRRAPVHLVQHMAGKRGVVQCLRGRGYYAVTSVRRARARWESAWLYNRMAKGRHYGLAWDVGYGEFMRRFPACALLAYYDGGAKNCAGEVRAEERVRRIARRYDEIIDLEKGDGGQVRAMLRGLGRPNRSDRPRGAWRGVMDEGRLRNESLLYEALVRRREVLLRAADGRRLFCGWGRRLLGRGLFGRTGD